jgi:CBS domain containing-hemolysin-like protein
MVAVEKNTPMEEIKNIFLEYEFSRLPVYDGSIDKIVGMIHEKDFYTVYFNQEKTIRRVIQKVVFTTPHMKISALLSQLQKEKVHLAIVTDEYGGTRGLVTMEDILEELVGEIWDEHDDVITYFRKLSEDTYAVDGNAPLHELFDTLEMKEPEEFEATTVGGWVTEVMELIPSAGDTFDYKNLHIEVTKTDARRVIEIKLTVNEIEDEEDDRRDKKEEKEEE